MYAINNYLPITIEVLHLHDFIYRRWRWLSNISDIIIGIGTLVFF